MKISNKSALNKIKEPVKAEFAFFNQEFKESFQSSIPLLNKVTHYLVKRKGKQMRPLFVLLSAKMIGDVSEKTYRAASLIELMHTATLIHDDVVDDANKRRGVFSINALWKNKVAVLVGDFLLSKSLILAIDNGDFDQLKNLSTAVKEMSEGELLQIEKARKLDITEEVYFDIIKAKTASLIRSACRAGAMSATDDEAMVELFGEIGETIGIAFQIKDDLLDYGDSNIGKPKGIDIKEQKMTLPLIYVLQKVDSSTKTKIKRTIKHHNLDKNKVQEVVNLVKKHGGIDYAIQVMMDYKNKALSLLEDIPNSPAKTSFLELIEYSISRKK